MSTRRDALRILVSTSAILPASGAALQQTRELSDQPGHVHESAPVKVPIPSEPTFLQPGEFHTVEALSECIIPKTDTPGAREAGVALLIDKTLVVKPALASDFRAGLADLNAVANQNYGANFADLPQAQQVALLTPMSLDTTSSMGRFFIQAKNMTVDAYYKTEAGLKQELGYHGNTYLKEFPGCDHPEHHT